MTTQEFSFHAIKKQIERGEYAQVKRILDSLPESSEKLELELWNFICHPNSYVLDDTILKIEELTKETSDDLYIDLMALLAKARYVIFNYVPEMSNNQHFISKLLEEIGIHFLGMNVTDLKFEISINELELLYILEKAHYSLVYEKNKDIGIALLLQGYELANDEELLFWKRHFCRYLSFYNLMSGDLTISLEKRKESLEISKILNNEFFIVDDLHGLGVIYNKQGEIDLALEILQNALKLCKSHEELPFQTIRTNILVELGKVRWYEGISKETEEYFNKAILINKNLFNANLIAEERFKISQSEAFMFLNELALYHNDFESSEKYLSELENLKVEESTIIQYQLSKVRYLMKKGNPENKDEALSLLESIVNSQVVYFDITFPAMVLFTEILIKDFESSNNKKILDKIDNTVKLLKNVSGSKEMVIGLTVLESKLLLVKGQLELAESLLESNLAVAKNIGLGFQIIEITQELAKLKAEKKEWTKNIRKGNIFSVNLKLADFNSYFNQAKHIV